MNAELAIRRLQAVVRRQHKALSTEETYVYWLRRYMASLPRFPATMTSEKKVERFLSDLVRHRDISASSQNQAFNAILLLGARRKSTGHPAGDGTRLAGNHDGIFAHRKPQRAQSLGCP